MTPRGSFGAPEIVRENATVLVTAARLVADVLVPILLASFVLSTMIGPPSEVITPATWLRQLGSGEAIASLGHLAVVLAVLFAAVTFEILLVCRAAVARGGPDPIAEVRDAARRLVRALRRAVLLAVHAPAFRPAPRTGTGADHDVLRQLRRALSISPAAPPLALAVVGDALGPAYRSGLVAEVVAAAR